MAGGSSADPYAFDLGGGGKSSNMSDIYAFEIDAPADKKKTTKANPYDFSIDNNDSTVNPKKQDKNAVTIKPNKFNSQPYAFDVPDKTQKKGSNIIFNYKLRR